MPEIIWLLLNAEQDKEAVGKEWKWDDAQNWLMLCISQPRFRWMFPYELSTQTLPSLSLFFAGTWQDEQCMASKMSVSNSAESFQTRTV